MPTPIISTVAFIFYCVCVASWCSADQVVFEDDFHDGLSERWTAVGLAKEDYRVREGVLELKLRPAPKDGKSRMLKVAVPCTTKDTVIASVDVSVVGKPLPRGAATGLLLTKDDDDEFRATKTNIDGYFVFSPGEPEFIGGDGNRGDPANYTVRYWPVQVDSGPLKIIVQGPYAHFQTGPSKAGKYKTYFHSAIVEIEQGMGFGLMAVGDSRGEEQWVRFDNVKITRNN